MYNSYIQVSNIYSRRYFVVSFLMFVWKTKSFSQNSVVMQGKSQTLDQMETQSTVVRDNSISY